MSKWRDRNRCQVWVGDAVKVLKNPPRTGMVTELRQPSLHPGAIIKFDDNGDEEFIELFHLEVQR